MPVRSGIPRDFGARRRARSTGSRPAKKIFDSSMGLYGRWFTGAVVNTCYNALDRHVAGRARRSGGADPRFAADRQGHEIHLCRDAARGRNTRRHHAGFRRRQGRSASSSICRWCRKPYSRCWPARGSARVHSVVFGGFAAKELATRIEDAKPTLIFSASCGLEPRPHRAVQAAARRGRQAVQLQTRKSASSCSGRS